MGFPYLQIPHFLDRLDTMFFDKKFLKNELLKSGFIFAHFYRYRTDVFLARNIFCYRNLKVCMH